MAAVTSLFAPARVLHQEWMSNIQILVALSAAMMPREIALPS